MFEDIFLLTTVLPVINSITETERALARGSIKVMSGKPFAVSHFETALLLTPIFSASSVWELLELQQGCEGPFGSSSG